MGVVGTSHIKWVRSWRVIPSLSPQTRLFENMLSVTEEADALRIIDATSARVRMAGTQRTKKRDQYVLAPLSYFSREPGRFTTKQFGAYYAAKTLRTAIEETVFHTERFMRRTDEPAADLPRRALVASITGNVHDIRGKRKQMKTVYSAGSYFSSQKLAKCLKSEGSNGIAYDSVRHPGGECAAVYNAELLSNCREDRTLVYRWDGARIGGVSELREFLKRND